MRKILFILLSATVVFSSCKKETRPGPQAQVKFINGSVNTVNAQVYFDEVLLIGITSFPNASNYSFVSVGTPTIKVQATSNATTTYVVSGSSSLQNNINYTIIAADSAHKLKISVVTDDITSPSEGKAGVRLFHLAGNAPMISVDTTNNLSATNTMFSSRTFNDQATSSSAASFIGMNAGTYTFTAKNGTTVLFTKSITLASGKLYTVAATGAVGATVAPQALDFTVIPHN